MIKTTYFSQQNEAKGLLEIHVPLNINLIINLISSLCVTQLDINSKSYTASSVKQLVAGEAAFFTDKLLSRWQMLVALLLLVNSLSSTGVLDGQIRFRESNKSDIWSHTHCSALWEDLAEDLNSESQYELKHFSSNDLSCSQHSALLDDKYLTHLLLFKYLRERFDMKAMKAQHLSNKTTRNDKVVWLTASRTSYMSDRLRNAVIFVWNVSWVTLCDYKHNELFFCLFLRHLQLHLKQKKGKFKNESEWIKSI